MNVHRPFVNEGPLPHRLQKLSAREDACGVFGKELEKLEFLHGETNGLAVDRGLELRFVDADRSADDRGLARFRAPLGSVLRLVRVRAATQLRAGFSVK